LQNLHASTSAYSEAVGVQKSRETGQACANPLLQGGLTLL